MTVGGMRGVVVKGIGGFYYVHAADGHLYTLRARGAFRKQKITLLAGDYVCFTQSEEEEESWIDEILPRKNMLIRPPVANVAYLIIVIAPLPKPDLLMVDTLLVEARRQNITPALVINKADLDPLLCKQIAKEYLQTGDPTFITSALRRQGLNALEILLRQGICCFAGQSGVGKSSLVSAITGIALDTGEISQKVARGKHTTRHTELLINKGFQVLDTAGFSLLNQAEPEDPILLKNFYPEFAPFEKLCRFQPCYHFSEPECAVLKARDSKQLSHARVARYHYLLESGKKAWRGRYD